MTCRQSCLLAELIWSTCYTGMQYWQGIRIYTRRKGLKGSRLQTDASLAVNLYPMYPHLNKHTYNFLLYVINVTFSKEKSLFQVILTFRPKFKQFQLLEK